ncbi:hypothetical protein EBL89_14685 [Cereibacter sphaeroides]|nr:hypothetical protein EBL89_14685 [Cereibacter sphaeroides]AZB60783.1 hypothetical protein EBL88_14725 [Cereibacter sphaeroides]
MQLDQNDLIDTITTYLDATGMPPTRFGKAVANDASLVASLKAGRDPRRSTVRRILSFIEDNPPTDNRGAA